MAASSADLHALAESLGIELGYQGWTGKPVVARDEALRAVIAALGVDVDAADALRDVRRARWEEVAPPVAVAWDGRDVRIELRVRADYDGPITISLTTESGAVNTFEQSLFGLPPSQHVELDAQIYCVRTLTLPIGEIGYHRMGWQLGERSGETLIIAAPMKSYRADPDARRWGVFAPLYALHRAGGGAIGDLGDLARLGQYVRDRGGAYLGTLPLLAGFLSDPCEPSPYAAASRLMWNELYLELGNPTTSSTASPLIDYRSEYAWRREVINARAAKAWTLKKTQTELLEFAARPDVLGYAMFRAYGETRGGCWQWSAHERAAVRAAGHVDVAILLSDLSAAVQRKSKLISLPIELGVDIDLTRVRAHVYAQHEMECTLTAWPARAGVGLYLDLPVGVGSNSYDVFVQGDQFVLDASTGAPPDGLFIGGQDWGLPPLHPQRIRKSQWRYLIEIVRHHMRHAAMLRVDHVMGLHRLYWVPRGMPATDGVYVRYAADELWAILCLESHRYQCELVGENLGTVPAAVPIAMTAHDVSGLEVRQFSLPYTVEQAPAVIPKNVVASLNTHDTPTFAGCWCGDDVAILRELGLIDDQGVINGMKAAAQRRFAVLHELVAAGLAPRGLDSDSAAAEDAAMRGLLRQLAASPARDVLVTLEDLWLERSPQNVPGTSFERPNWTRPFSRSLEQILDDADIRAQLDAINAARMGTGS